MQICCKNSIHLVGQMRKKKSSYTSKRRKRKSNSHIKVVNMAKHRRRPSFKSNLLSLLIFPLIIQLQLNCDTRGLGLALQTSPSALEDAAGQEQQQQQQQQRFLLEPSDTVALVGQSQAQLTCLIGNKQGPLRWFKHHLWLSNEAQMFTDKARYSIRISSRSSDALEPPDSPEPSNATSHLNNLQQGFKSVSNYTLNIANVTLNDDADYHCAIYGSLTDDSGSGGNIISRGARLEVVQAPTRLEITTSKVAEDGDDIDGNNERAEQTDNNLQFGHQVVGFTPSSSSSSVPESQSESHDQRRPITRIIVKENDRLKLECKANQAKPRAELVWFDAHNRKVPILPTGSGQRDSITANGTTDFAEPFVHIDPEAPRLELATLVWPFRVQRHHHNQILTCRASHKALELQQRQPLEQRVQLEVLYEPTIEGLVKNETLEGQAVKFSCSAHARPSQLNYSWFIDDQPVENANKSHLVVQQLTRQLHMRDVKCLVANSVGNSSAVHRPSVKYSPAYVTHLLPASLQPEPSPHHKFHLFAASRSLSKHATSNGQTPGLGASQLLLAQQLAQGHKEGADVTLRCDFDSNPRPKSIEWFRINTDYDSMTDVTPQEADELIEFGAGHAIFRRPDEEGQVVTVKGAEQQQSSHHQKRHIDWNLPATNANNNNHQPENQIQLDYEEMSSELLSELSLYEQNQAAENSSSSSSSSPLFTLINSTDSQTTHTVAKITEPLGWLFVSSPSPGSSNRRTLVNNNTGRFVASHNQYQVLESLQHQQQAVEEELMLMSTQPANSSKLNHRQAQLTSSQLTIKAFNADQSGRYICRANGERPFGSAARGIYLVVRRMPRIISVSQQWAPLGARQVQVECLAQINTVYDNQTAIVWSRNGNIIKPTRQNCDRQQHQDNNSQVEKCIDIQVRFSPDLLFVRSILRVHNSNYQDFGHYNCTITNSFRPDFHIINLQPSAPTGLTFKLLVALTLASVVLCVLIISSILAFAPCKRLDSLATKSAAIIACSSSVCSSPTSESSPSPPTGKDSDTKVRNETNSDSSLEKPPGMSMVGYDDVEGAKSMLINNQHLLANMQHGQRARQTAPNRPGSAHGLDSNQRSQRNQNELRSSFRQPQHSSMSLNGNNNNKFAAIHESLESKLQFGRNNLDNYHQQPVSRSTQLEGSTAGSETTTTDVSETATNMISDSNTTTTATTSKLEPSTNDENGASLMERIWSRLQQRRLDGRTVQGAAATAGRRQPRQMRVINGKSRPTISMPIVQKSPLSTGSNSSSLSLRRSSLSDSLTVVNSQLQVASHHQQHSANNVGSHQKNSSRANLIQDNGMASSDGLATSGSSSSGRSSSTSNQQQNANHHHHHHHHHQVAATLSSGQAYEMWPANAIYANSSAVYTNGCDLSTTSYLIDQQQQLAWASSHPEALDQVADLNGANGHYQLPLQMAACNEPYQVTHNNNNDNHHHQQIDSRPCHPSICNKPNNFQLQTTDAGDAFYESNYGTLISKSSAYKTLGYSNSIAGHNQTGNSITTSTALHINPTSQLATTTTLTPPSHHGGSSTASGSPNSLTTHANNTSHTNLSSQQAHILPAHSQLYNHQHVVVSAPQTLYHPNELSLVLNSQESNHFQATTTTMQSDGTLATSALTPKGTSHTTKTNRASPAHLAVANQREPLATHV